MRRRPLNLAEFRAANLGPGTRCTLFTFLRTLPPRDQHTLRQAISDHSIQSGAIIRILRPMGYMGGHQIIQRHRQEGCRDCDTAPRGK